MNDGCRLQLMTNRSLTSNYSNACLLGYYSTVIFQKLDQFLCNLVDKPCTPHFDNSVVLDGRKCSHFLANYN